jgi:hypothetical protein
MERFEVGCLVKIENSTFNYGTIEFINRFSDDCLVKLPDDRMVFIPKKDLRYAGKQTHTSSSIQISLVDAFKEASVDIDSINVWEVMYYSFFVEFKKGRFISTLYLDHRWQGGLDKHTLFHAIENFLYYHRKAKPKYLAIGETITGASVELVIGDIPKEYCHFVYLRSVNSINEFSQIAFNMMNSLNENILWTGRFSVDQNSDLILFKSETPGLIHYLVELAGGKIGH